MGAEVQPELGGERRQTSEVSQFSFDPKLLDTLFTELAPAPEPEPKVVLEAEPYAMATDFLSKGLYDRAMAEAYRRAIEAMVRVASGRGAGADPALAGAAPSCAAQHEPSAGRARVAGA